MTEEKPTLVPIHQWTNGGSEVLILKCCDKDGKSYGGFQWPDKVGAVVEAPVNKWNGAPADIIVGWNPSASCGGGLHGWAWSVGMGCGKMPDWSSTRWIVFGALPGDVIGFQGKCKAARGTVRFIGNWRDALNFVRNGRNAWIKYIATSPASSGNYSTSASSGNYSTSASSGYSSTSASSGDYSTSASSGDYSTSASSGYSSTSASSGDYSTSASSGNYSTSASSGYYSTSASSGDYSTSASSGNYSTSASSGNYSTSASSGDYSTSASSGNSSKSSATGLASPAVCAGINCKAKAAMFGSLSLGWLNKKENRREMRSKDVGIGDGSDGKLKADVWYRLDDAGEFVEVKE